MIALQHLLKGVGADNLTFIILKALEAGKKLDPNDDGYQASMFWCK